MGEKSIKGYKAQKGCPQRLEGSIGTCLPRAHTLAIVSTTDHCWEDDATQGIKYCYNGDLQASPAHHPSCGKGVFQK